MEKKLLPQHPQDAVAKYQHQQEARGITNTLLQGNLSNYQSFISTSHGLWTTELQILCPDGKWLSKAAAMFVYTPTPAAQADEKTQLSLKSPYQGICYPTSLSLKSHTQIVSY